MFHKHLLRSTVALEPECLGPDTSTAIEQVLEERYVNKVIHGKGLVALVLGVERVGEGRIFHSDGRVYYDVVWSGLLFCPETEELLLLSLQSQNGGGMFLSSDCFEDFYVPPGNMEELTKWDGDRWVFYHSEEWVDGSEFETGKKMWVRVYSLEFKTGHEADAETSRFSVNCRINRECLGMRRWVWEDNEDGNGGGAEQGGEVHDT